MEQMRYTAAEALDVFDAVISSMRSDDRPLLSAPERVVLMQRARRFRDRLTSWTCVLTDEASLSSLSATGTPLTSLIGIYEGRDSGDAAKEVLEARGINRNSTIRDAALNGEVSPRHAAAIVQGLDKLPPGLTTEQTQKAEQAFITRAPKNTPKRLSELAAEVLAEVAPELVPDAADDDAVLEAQRRRARTKRHLKWGDDGDGSMWFKGSLPHLKQHHCSRWSRHTSNPIVVQNETASHPPAPPNPAHGSSANRWSMTTTAPQINAGPTH